MVRDGVLDIILMKRCESAGVGERSEEFSDCCASRSAAAKNTHLFTLKSKRKRLQAL